MIKQIFIRKRESGQMMILLIITMSATALAALALSSFLVVAQLRQVSDARLSSSAIFAADAGIECILLHEFNSGIYNLTGCPVYGESIDACSGAWSGESSVISGGASYRFRCDPASSSLPSRKVFISVGKDKPGVTPTATRALQITLIKI